MKKLQDFNFLRSQYERPTQRRTCGARAFGKACQMGPDKDGSCRGQFECVPAKKKDRWHCTRSAENGGACQHGPSPDGVCCNRLPPCQPENSLRHARGRVTAWVVVFVCAVLALVYLSEESFETFADPGGLSSSHSFKDQKCANCHQTDGDLWRRALATAGPAHANGFCLECHEIDATAESAHNIAPETLARMVESKAAAAGVPQPRVPGELKCASCHSEHKGSDHDLTVMPEGRCETCHVTRHPEFATQHPDFEAYPYKRRTRLVFDHGKHFAKHFKKDKLADVAPTECKACHKLDEDKAYMLTVDFDRSCGSCHEKGTTGESLSDPGIRILALPYVDTESLADREVNIGAWPEGPEDPYMPPVLWHILAADPALTSAVHRIIDEDDPVPLDDLSEVEDEVAQEVGAVMRALKLLLARAKEDGPAVFGEALGAQDGAAASLFKGLDAEQLGLIVDRWFPDLESELDDLRAGTAATELAEAAEAEEDDAFRAGTWKEQYFALMYRPAGHADPVMQAWLDVAGRSQGEESVSGSLLFEQFADDKLSGQCGKCHSGDASEDGIRYNWPQASGAAKREGLTYFRHEPHLNQPGIEDCQSCHKLNSEADYLASFKDHDPATFSSNFTGLEKQLCADCHTDGQAGQACSTCHYYHFVETSPAQSASSVINRPVGDAAKKVD